MIAHQWFGNSVTESDWDDAWLSEGFATYFTLLYDEHYVGRDAFLRGVQGMFARARTAAQTEKPLVHENISDLRGVNSAARLPEGRLGAAGAARTGRNGNDLEGRVERIDMTQPSQRFEITADGPPADVVLDPNSWMLMEPPKFGRRTR